jgi:transposase InsO family protein
VHIGHGNADVIVSGVPPTLRVKLDVVIVHKDKIFQQPDVWFLVYEGCLPDAMISDSMLNSIPCTSHPGTTLIDTRARPSDLSLLLQQIEDYSALSRHRICVATTQPITPLTSLPTSSPRPHSVMPSAWVNIIQHVPAAAPSLVRPDDGAMEPLSQHPQPVQSVEPPGSAQSSAPAHPPASPAQTDQERIAALLLEMKAQRARLMQRLGKPVSAEALMACMAILDRYPENFRPPGTDACKLGVFKIVLKDKSKFHVALPRRVNPIMLTEIRRQVEELVAVGAIERCITRPSSVYAIVMARRPNAPGKYRLCIDLVAGNDNTEPNPYAVPEVQQALDRLSGHKLYSTFDFTTWFSQFELAEEDRDKMAFVVPGDNLTPPQIYRYKRVCFGALNATYFCQRQLQEALETFPGCQGIYPFVDDIVLAADSLEEMLEKLEAFMRFCRHYNLRLNKTKTELVSTAVRHVGFILSEEGQSLDPARVDSLLAIGSPRNIVGLKSLLGSFGFIRGWLADMAGVAAPLTDLMSGTARRLNLDWGPAQEAALNALKLAAQLAPAKVAPDYRLPFEVYVDASDVGVAAVLIQWRQDLSNPTGSPIPMAIMHASRRWSVREAKWEISSRELYAIKYGLFKFREYLQGCPNVTVHSDHLNLVNGLWKHSNPKIARWRMFLESMRPFTLKHVRGTDKMQVPADCLSRLHVLNLTLERTEEEQDPDVIRMMERGEGEDDDQMFNDAAFRACAATQTEFLQALHTTVNCSARILTEHESALRITYGRGFALAERMGWSIDNFFAPLQPTSKAGMAGIGYASQRPHACDTTTSAAVSRCEILCVEAESDWREEDEDRNEESFLEPGSRCAFAAIAIMQSSQTTPQDFKDAAYNQAGGFPLRELLERAHDDTHPGFQSTWRRVVRALGPQPGAAGAAVKAEVKRFCEACLCCQKLQPARAKLLMEISSIRQRPFSTYAFDIVVLSEEDLHGCRYILVCVDSFTRAVELFALKQANAISVVECLNDVLCRWGRAHEVRCDNAKAFTSAVVKALLDRAKVKQHLTAPYSHQSNGQVENCNRRVMEILRAMIIDDRLGINSQTKWSLLLPDVRRVLMTRMIIQHGCTPNDLAYMNCPETEASIFAEEAWMPPTESNTDRPIWVNELARQHQVLIDICEERQDALLQKLASANERAQAGKPLKRLLMGDFVLLKMIERPHAKTQAPWAGPYLVVSFPNNDCTSSTVTLQHIANKKVGVFHLNMLKFCDMSLLATIEDAMPYAAKDNFEYEIEAVLAHSPAGPRRISTGLRNKSDYMFQCLWKDLPLNADNPSWEPWTNESMRSCEAYQDYIQQPQIIVELGAKF